MPTLTLFTNTYVLDSRYVTLRDEYFTETQRNASLTAFPDPLGADNDKLARALISSTKVLDSSYLWFGYRVNQTQALEWPRTGVPYNGRYTKVEYDPLTSSITPTFPTNMVPLEIELAVALLAASISDKFVTVDNSIDSVSIEGAVSIRFKSGSEVQESRDIIPAEADLFARKYAIKKLPSLNVSSGTRMAIMRRIV